MVYYVLVLFSGCAGLLCLVSFSGCAGLLCFSVLNMLNVLTNQSFLVKAFVIDMMYIMKIYIQYWYFITLWNDPGCRNGTYPSLFKHFQKYIAYFKK